MRSRIAISIGLMMLHRSTPSFQMNHKWLLVALRAARMSGCAELSAKQSELITELDPLATRNQRRKIQLHDRGEYSI